MLEAKPTRSGQSPQRSKTHIDNISETKQDTAMVKQQISNFYLQIQRTDASDHIYASHRPVVNVKASFCA